MQGPLWGHPSFPLPVLGWPNFLALIFWLSWALLSSPGLGTGQAGDCCNAVTHPLLSVGNCQASSSLSSAQLGSR